METLVEELVVVEVQLQVRRLVPPVRVGVPECRQPAHPTNDNGNGQYTTGKLHNSGYSVDSPPVAFVVAGFEVFVRFHSQFAS